MSNSHIDNLVTAITNKISSLIGTHNTSSTAHSTTHYTQTQVDTALAKKKSHFYGTCSTTASTQIKAVTSTDFELATGAIISIKFTNGNTYNGTAKLQINSETAIDVATVGTTKTSRYYWVSGEVVTFVYDGTNFVMMEGGTATTTYYGVTKLSDSTSSTSTSLAATANAVKTAYDLASTKADSTHTHTKSQITDFPTIPDVSGKEDVSNKSSSIATDTGSTTKYPTVKAVEDALSGVGGGAEIDDYYLDTSTDEIVLEYVNASGNGGIDVTDLNDVTTVNVVVTYTDNTTETLSLLKYTGS